MAIVKLRLIDVDKHSSMRVDILERAITNDHKAGLTPFFVAATLGTTGSCAFDNILEIGKVCKKFPQIWFHVDAAYGGNSFICPEMRFLAEGLEYADSFNTNPNKLLLTNFDASAMWVKDVATLQAALTINPLYLHHEHDSSTIDYRHFGIPLSRRFRALKLWFVFRLYGISGIQKYIRNHIKLAKVFEALVNADERFEVRNDVHLGLVCFRLKAPEICNHDLLAEINHSGKIHMVPAMVNGEYSIRFCVTYEHATEEHIVNAWNTIKAYAEEILSSHELDMEANSSKQTEKLNKKPKFPRKKPSPFSFIRSTSQDVIDSQVEHLRDGCTPIFVVDCEAYAQKFKQATLSDNQNKIQDSKEKGTLRSSGSKKKNF